MDFNWYARTGKNCGKAIKLQDELPHIHGRLSELVCRGGVDKAQDALYAGITAVFMLATNQEELDMARYAAALGVFVLHSGDQMDLVSTVPSRKRRSQGGGAAPKKRKTSKWQTFLTWTSAQLANDKELPTEEELESLHEKGIERGSQHFMQYLCSMRKT